MGAESASTNFAKVAKALLFATNLLFLIGGGLLLGLGLWIRLDGDSYYTVLGKGGPEIPSTVMIAAGAAIILISFIGCIGAMLESRCLLLTFVFVLCFILAAQIVIVSLSILYKDELKDKVTDVVTENFQLYYGQSDHEDVTKSIDKIQGELECCGTSNYSSWNNSKYADGKYPYILPLSCCRSGVSPECRRGLVPSQIYTADCIDELTSWANTRFVIVISVGIGVVIFEILGICFALMVMRYI